MNHESGTTFIPNKNRHLARCLATSLSVLAALLALGCADGDELAEVDEAPAGEDLSNDGDNLGSGDGDNTMNGDGDDTTGGDGDAPLAAPGTDVCGARPEVTWGPVEDDGFVTVPPGDPLIRFGGRVDCTDLAAPAFAYPAASIALRFEGTGLDVILGDHGTGTAQTTNFYDVSIDGAEPTLLEAVPGESTYSLARDLGDGEHAVLIVKRTESGPVGHGNSGRGELLGLRLPEGARLLPVPTTGRRVEFIGDSITCGYGNELSTDMPDAAHYTSANSNANSAYGAITARLLDAEYTAVSYSGKGVSRNVSGDPGALLPDIYARSFPDDPASPLFPVQNAIPDALVVNLGTNDFSPGGVNREAYVARYVEFLETLRAFYPETAFVCAVGPMISDYYPAGENAWTNIRADVQIVIAERAAAGDSNIAYLEFAPQVSPYGEDWHPTVATHTQMAEQTAELIRDLMGW